MARVRQLHVHGELGQQRAARDWIKTQPDGKIHPAKAPITNDFGTSATVLSRSLQVPAPWHAHLLKWQQRPGGQHVTNSGSQEVRVHRGSSPRRERMDRLSPGSGHGRRWCAHRGWSRHVIYFALLPTCKCFVLILPTC